jgi:hypothetical protein
LDYEGQMDMGNIHSDTLESVLKAPRRLETVRNAMVHKVCRECMGNVWVFEGSPLDVTEQSVDRFGFGWYGFESAMFGLGGRWSSGRGQAYAYPRLQVRSVEIEFYSPHESGEPFSLDVCERGPDDAFHLVKTLPFYGKHRKTWRVKLPFEIAPFHLYRFTITSPVFVPSEQLGTADNRSLGLAVFDFRLKGEIVAAPQARDIVQISSPAKNATANTLPV